MTTGAPTTVGRRRVAVAAAVLVGALFAARPAAGLDRLCDPSFENCRTQLLDLINRETQGIDVAFWFMEDPRYLAAITAKWRAGVPVRLLMDPRASATYPLNAGILQGFQDAGVPMRMRSASGILHWKLMLFAGQGIVEFSGANYSDNAFKPVTPYVNYVDESILFTDDPAIVNTFMTKFDASWIDRSSFSDYANITVPLARHYPVFTQAAELNFPPGQSYATRAIALYTEEQTGIDVIMYRVTDRRHSDAMIAAHARGVPVRIITDLKEYRVVAKLWHAWNIDRMWAAGIPMRVPAHAGMNHQKSVILAGQRTVIFGSSNWTSPSDGSQQEHNFFSHSSAWILNWFADQFDRKWNGTNALGVAETKPFVPLPPDAPKAVFPKTLATGVSRSVKLSWYGGPWAHAYDVYFGSSPTPPRVATNKNLGPSLTTAQNQGFTVSGLAANTTYYWKVVSKTAAGKTKSGAIWSFTTGS